jgi:ATP-dependent Clp protease ATP-binding subunit ClpC
MKIEIPVLVEQETDSNECGSLYRVRPLFFPSPQRTDRNLSTALMRLAERLEKQLHALGRQGDHRQLADWTFSPDVELHWLDLRLDLRGEMFRGHFPVVTLRQLDRILAFSPRLDEAWFELPRPKDLDQQATEVYTRWFRRVFKERGEEPCRELLKRFENKKRPWITLVELFVATRMDRGKADTQGLAMLGGSSIGSGAEELAAVGRCQDYLYPDGLSRAVCRGQLIEELQRLLESDGRRPLLLVGPPLVGKTALIHEFIYQRAEQRVARYELPTSDPNEKVWLLAPQRLISGMSYVGQWENRWLAILKEAQERQHILYFDDLLGLYHAGVTSQSTLSVADVLKPYVERREVRVLAEATPEQLRIFRERDRGFADMFQIIRVQQPADEETLRILLNVIRSLESQHGVRFGLDALPAVLELTRCWQPEAAFPGKAATWLNRLAVKHRGGAVGRNTVLEEFRVASGLQMAFADTRTRLLRGDIVAGLRRRIIGQAAAVAAMADVVAVGKARLNDRQKPLGTLFFLGPTGVGKTECAKALAQYLFGDAARLVRFDMNEFVSPQAAARLAGTFDQPEGLLTGAVRRQPFCVLLLDEIEKAHPDVFDLLLQILGEARLTDAMGRTASFANVVIILTSNLGTRQAARDVGFAPPESTADSIYLQAVEEFFRPEFLNRLDRIVPFQRLQRDELNQIARAILADVVAREGLTRRKCAIELAGDALDWIVDRGCHRELGARAMRRAVERELVRPMARQLAAITPDVPTVMSARYCGDALAVRVAPLEEMPRRTDLARPERIDNRKELLARAQAALNRVQAASEAHRPPMRDGNGRIMPQYHWYSGVSEFLRQTRALAASIADEAASPRRSHLPPMIAPKQGRSRRYLASSRQVLKEIYTAQDVLEYVRELADTTDKQARSERPDIARYRRLLDRLALADAFAPGPNAWPSERALLLIRGIGDSDEARESVADHLCAKYSTICADSETESSGVEFGLECTHWKPSRRRMEDRIWWEEIHDAAVPPDRYRFNVLLVEGYKAQALLRYESGTHLCVCAEGRLDPVQAVVVPVPEGQSPWGVLLDVIRRYEQPRETAGSADATDDPFNWRPTISLHVLGGKVTDLQSGAVCWPGGDLMASLPLPPELRDLLDLRGDQ